MKPFTLVFVFLLSLVACKKETTPIGTGDVLLASVKAALKDSMRPSIFDSLDFSKAVVFEVDSVDLHVLHIPLVTRNSESFLLVHTDKAGHIKRGIQVWLEQKKESQNNAPFRYDGHITLRSLKNDLLLQSEVLDGHIRTGNPGMYQGREEQGPVLQPIQPANDMLPAVIVIGYRELNGALSYSNWINIQTLFGGGGAYYSPTTSSGGTTTTSGGGVYRAGPILVDFEKQNSNAAIDIEAYLRCFGRIPDAGATCSIEIFSDIPVDSDPNKLLNWETESPGHSFLQIRKSNGSQSVIQNIGFYPRTNWKTILTPAPVEGKFVDNGRHEFNASLRMSVTPLQLQSALTQLSSLARFVRYDIDEYNCTDLALEVFNAARHPANKLEIPKYEIPGGMAPYGTNTPQGLYNKLKSMQQSGSTEASNISVPGVKGWVATSSGPCN